MRCSKALHKQQTAVADERTAQIIVYRFHYRFGIPLYSTIVKKKKKKKGG